MTSDKVELEGKRLPIRRIGYQRLKSVSFSIDGREYMAIEQNPEKASRWGQLAKEGHAVVQFISSLRSPWTEYGAMAKRKHSRTQGPVTALLSCRIG